jgi:hypothetical protein
VIVEYRKKDAELAEAAPPAGATGK